MEILSHLQFLPDGITHTAVFWLCIGSFAAALITTTVGIGGGLVLIGIMSVIMPVTSVLAIHSLNQGLAAISRAYILRAHIIWRFFFVYLGGSVLGLLVAREFFVALSEETLEILLGSGLIVLNLIPKFEFGGFRKRYVFVFGIFTAFSSVFIGPVGPLLGMFLASFVRQRHAIVAMVAFCNLWQNLGKSVLFASIGFDYVPWIIVLVLTFACAQLGTLLGKRILDKGSNEGFKKVLKFVIIGLGVKLIITALYKMYM